MRSERDLPAQKLRDANPVSHYLDMKNHIIFTANKATINARVVFLHTASVELWINS